MSVDRIRSRAARLPWPVFALLALAACGSGGSGQSGTTFVFLTVSQITGNDGQGSASSSLDDPGASTAACVAITNSLKNPTVTAPTVLDTVTITSYTVSFTRFDGGPPPGPFTLGTSFSIPAGTSVTATIVIVPASAKRNPPLNPRPRLPLGTTATILLKGRDARGGGISTQGSLTVTFVQGVTPEGSPTGCAAPAPSPSPTPTPTVTPSVTPTTTPTTTPTGTPTV